MRILLISNQFIPKWLAGVEIAVFESAKILVSKKNEVHVVTSLDPGLPSYEVIEGVHVHRVPFHITRLFGPLLFWTRILFEIKDINPDIIHVHSLSVGFPAMIARIVMGKRYVVTGHGSDVYVPWSSSPFISDILTIRTRNVYMTSTGICSV